MPTPVTRYAKSGETYIAYQVVGDGPPDLIWERVIGRISQFSSTWKGPAGTYTNAVAAVGAPA